MTDYQNTYQTGLADGTALTVANSDDGTPSAGTAFTSVTGGTQQFTTTNFLFGSRSVSVAHLATTAAYHAWEAMAGATGAFAADLYFYMPSRPVTNDQVLFAFRRGAAGATGIAPILIRTNGNIRATSDAGGGTAIAESASVFNSAGHYRVSVYGQVDTATTGELHIRAYSVDATTKVETLIASTDSTTANLGTVMDVSGIRWGNSVNFAPAYTWTFHVARFRTGSMTPFAAYSVAGPNVAPTVDAGPNQIAIEPWSTVTLSGTATDSDGTIASRLWTQTAGLTATLSGATTATATYEAAGAIGGHTQTFSFAATDDDGATSSDTVSVSVLPVTERAAVGGVLVPLRIRG